MPIYKRRTCKSNINTANSIVLSYNLYGTLTMINLDILKRTENTSFYKNHTTSVEEIMANKLRHHSTSKLLNEFNAMMR